MIAACSVPPHDVLMRQLISVGGDLPGKDVIITGIRYDKYPYAPKTRPKKVPKKAWTRADAIKCKACRLVKLHISILEDGRCYGRMDMMLDSKRCHGTTGWRGHWKLIGKVDLKGYSITHIVDDLRVQGYAAKAVFNERRLSVIMAMRNFGAQT
jgi:hypothetical protein